MFGARRDRVASVFLGVAICAGCGGNVDAQRQKPRESSEASPPSPPQEPPARADASVVDQTIDIGGNEYLMNIWLSLDLTLRLRMLFTSYMLAASGTEAAVRGELRFEDETPRDPSIASFETVMDSQRMMLISTGMVVIPAQRSPVAGVEIQAQLNFASVVISEDFLCGRVEDDQSAVLQPILQQLKGTTFGAQRIQGGVIPAEVPNSCPN